MYWTQVYNRVLARLSYLVSNIAEAKYDIVSVGSRYHTWVFRVIAEGLLINEVQVAVVEVPRFILEVTVTISTIQ